MRRKSKPQRLDAKRYNDFTRKWSVTPNEFRKLDRLRKHRVARREIERADQYEASLDMNRWADYPLEDDLTVVRRAGTYKNRRYERVPLADYVARAKAKEEREYVEANRKRARDAMELSDAIERYGPIFGPKLVDGLPLTRSALNTIETSKLPFPQNEAYLKRNKRFHFVTTCEEQGVNPAVIMEWAKANPRVTRHVDRLQEFQKLVAHVYNMNIRKTKPIHPADREYLYNKWDPVDQVWVRPNR